VGKPRFAGFPLIGAAQSRVSDSPLAFPSLCPAGESHAPGGGRANKKTLRKKPLFMKFGYSEGSRDDHAESERLLDF